VAIQTLFGSVPQEPTLLERLKAGVEKTRVGLVDRIEDLISARRRSMPTFSTNSSTP
jgi:fused signal recognition particle receptor